MTDLRTLSVEQLEERLAENAELLRVKRREHQQLEDEVIAICFECDDIREEVRSRRVPLRLVASNG